MAKKKETVAEFARRRASEIENTDVNGTLKVAYERGLAVFSGDGYNPGRPSVEVRFGDGTKRRVATVDGVMQSISHEYSSGDFTATTQYTGGEEIASVRVRSSR